MNKALILSLLALVLILSACDHMNDKEESAQSNIEKIVNYGNGVFYFQSSSIAFAKTLSEFIGKYPFLELVTMVPNNSGYNGYFVVFKINPQEAKDFDARKKAFERLSK